MRPTLRTLPVAFPALALLAAACSSSSSSGSSGPVIDDLQMPATFTAAASASTVTYTAQGTITYHDDAAAVTALHTKIPTFMLDDKSAVSGTQQATAATIVLGFQAQSPVTSGTKVEIDVSLVDANGNESNTLVEQLTVP